MATGFLLGLWSMHLFPAPVVPCGITVFTVVSAQANTCRNRAANRGTCFSCSVFWPCSLKAHLETKGVVCTHLTWESSK